MAQDPKNVDHTVEEVDAAISKSEQFIENNKKNIGMFFVAIIVVVAACFTFKTCGDSKNEKAQDEIYQYQSLFEEGKYTEALEGFEQIIDNYGSTDCGNSAKAYAGLCQFNLGHYSEAIPLLKSFSGDDIVVTPAVLSALGDCYVNQETPDYAAGADAFMKAAKLANNAQFSPLFLNKAAIAFEAAGKNDKALEVYKQIRDNWFETEIGRNAEKYIETLK